MPVAVASIICVFANACVVTTAVTVGGSLSITVNTSIGAAHWVAKRASETSNVYIPPSVGT